MRIAIFAAVTTLGLGCIGVSGASAAPASGTAIKDTAAGSRVTVVEEHDRDHHRKHCYWRHGHRHCD